MELSYPQTTVWYVEARPAGESQADPQMGSAVVVTLCHKDSPKSARKYLLTCGHVVRRTAANGDGGFGSLYEDIRVWRPSVGYTLAAAHTGKVAPIGILGIGEVPLAQRAESNDWVLIDVEDLRNFQASDAVWKWSDDGTETSLSCVGYPFGKLAFEKDPYVVAPLQVDGFQLKQNQGLGTYDYVGNGETRKGMSGGGVFTDEGDFVGLHRSRQDGAQTSTAIQAKHIRSVLQSQGFEIVDSTSVPSLTAAEKRRVSINLVLAGVFIVLGIIWGFLVLGPVTMVSAIAPLFTFGVIGQGFAYFSAKARRKRDSIGGQIRTVLCWQPTFWGLLLTLITGVMFSLFVSNVTIEAFPEPENRVNLVWGEGPAAREKEVFNSNRKWFWTNPLGKSFQLQLKGYSDYPFTNWPWLGTRINARQKMTPVPFVLIYPDKDLRFVFPRANTAEIHWWKIKITRNGAPLTISAAAQKRLAAQKDLTQPIYFAQPILLGGTGKYSPPLSKFPDGKLPTGFTWEEIVPIANSDPIKWGDQIVVRIESQLGTLKSETVISLPDDSDSPFVRLIEMKRKNKP